MDVPQVALMMPMRCQTGQDTEALANGVVNKSTNDRFRVQPQACWTSLLTWTFNTLWAGSLNLRRQRPFRYVAMTHDDVVPDMFWLDTLVDELEATGADMMSAVVPIKDDRGITSTGVDDTGTDWSPRRLTMAEVMQLPETFGDKDVGGDLLLNTGLWVARFDREWNDQVLFRQQDRIIQLDTGEYMPQTKPEDWDFSRQLRALGCKLMATRKVGLYHERPEFTNRRVWGRWKTDLDCVAAESKVA